MPDARQGVSSEEASSRNVGQAGWGLLLIWIGAALLLHIDWGVGLVGAGAIVLAIQAFRRYRGLAWDRFGLVAGLLLVVGGVWNVLDVSVRLAPVLCIAFGIVLLVSAWTARRSPRTPAGQTDLHASSHPRP